MHRWPATLNAGSDASAAVLIVVATLFGVFDGAGWLLTRQLIDLAAKLPYYQTNIDKRLNAIRLPTDGAFWPLFAQRFRATKAITGLGGTTGEYDRSGAGNKSCCGRALSQRACGSTANAGSDRRIAKPSSANLQTIATGLLGPLGTAGLVLSSSSSSY